VTLDRVTLKPEPINGTAAWRMVESQHDNATVAITRSLAEQSRLEELLETSKPVSPVATKLHYRLSTPFRCPPLPHGSRFSDRFSPSLFYASLTVDGMLAESAYYRAVFWDDYSDRAEGDITTTHTAFTVPYRTKKGLRLHAPEFVPFHHILTHPGDYGSTQLLGARMRDAHIEAFEYASARSSTGAINLGMFSPHAFAAKKPTSRREWSCRIGERLIEFREHGSGRVEEFTHATFYVDGVLPRPAP
jgi:hypothetical protein